MSSWILDVSTLSLFASTTLDLICVSRSETVSAASRATETVDSDRARLSAIALKPDTSPRIVVAMDHEDELSLALSTRIPELMRFWVVFNALLVALRVCRAAMAPTFVRMLDIEFLPQRLSWM